MDGPGRQPADRAPQLESNTDKKLCGDGYSGLPLWNDVSLFGPIPTRLEKRAVELCEPAGMEPWGYHPNAIDQEGRKIPGGGFLCKCVEE
jgi:hypothetical protein